MPQKVRIALDAMGGDVGGAVVIPGAAISLTRHPDTEFLLFGERSLIEAQLAKHPVMKAVSRVIHTDVAVSMHDKPSQALRRGRKTSSMWLAIDAVKKGEADVAVPAGNTGALMAMGRFCLRMLPGIERPAIAAIWPTARGDSVILDVGATIGGDAQHIKTLALMGSAMASVLFDLERPTVGLLNIGVEEMKGREEVREAAELLRNLDLPQLNFIGFVEGGGIGKGAADVIVTEGFSGNNAIKVAEGTARQINEFLRAALSSTWRSKIGYLFARNAFKALKDKLDPNKSNGGVFLGLNGIVVKSHGDATPEGFAYAVDVGYEMRRYHILTKAELAPRLDTSDEWIVQRTGIRQRHIAAEGEFTSHLAVKAARAALAHAGIVAQSIDLIVLAASTPDNTFPATAVAVQNALGIHHGAAFDLQAVCSGFIFALATADNFLRSGAFKRALVIGAETFSRILDWNDRGTCVLFGDGAGAVVLDAELQPGKPSGRGILTTHLRSDGRHKSKLYVDGGPSSTQTVGYLRMEGREVFKHAVGMITDVIVDAFKATGTTAEDIDWFVPHQANKRIIDASAHKLHIAPQKVVLTVDLHGNTSAASIPLALAVAVADGRVKKGDLVLLEAMGGGFTWGSALLRW